MTKNIRIIQAWTGKLSGLSLFLSKLLAGYFLLAMFLALPIAAQAGQTEFFYDELGRLVGEADGNGDVSVYIYDAVGNLLSVQRHTPAASGIGVFLLAPSSGAVGTRVEIRGFGFSPTAADNQVAFNGTAAAVLSSTNRSIFALVPAGATTGPVTVTNANGTATSSFPFTVKPTISITLTPATATVTSGTSKQFTATVTGTTDQSVLWKLEGVGSLVGTLSDTGLYSVPSTFIGTALVIVKATSLADTTQFATATVTILPAGPLGPVIAPQVSVAISQAPVQTGPFVAPQVSVGISQSSAPSGPFLAPQVSVGIDQGATPQGPFIAPQVSVGIDQTAVLSGPFVAPQVSVGVDQSSTATGPFVAPQVSVSLISIISSITPGSGTQGVTDLLITLTGTGLSNATSMSFLLNGAADTSITAANLMSNAEGTQATANITVSGTAPIGLRVVRITTSNGTSPAAMMEGNVFDVTVP